MGKVITVVVVLAVLAAAIITFGFVPVMLPIAFVASAGILATMLAVASSRNAY